MLLNQFFHKEFNEQMVLPSSSLKRKTLQNKIAQWMLRAADSLKFSPGSPQDVF